MNVVTIDFETYWAKDHTLSKMLPMTYVMHPETELISMSAKVDGYPTDVFFGEPAIRKALKSIPWDDKLIIGHNLSGFDGMILAWRLGIKPKMWGCTLAMARPLHNITVGGSLKKLVEHYGLGVKDASVLHNTQGKHLKDFTQEELDAMRDYNRADTDQCYALFQKLKPHYSAKELWHIDASIRMLLDTRFVVDYDLLDDALKKEQTAKRKQILLLAKHVRSSGLGSEAVAAASTVEELEEAVRADMASAPKFGKLLESLGVPVPTKPSPSNPDKVVPALAKTDEAFTALLEHENEIVAAATRTRLSVKSTILETRIQAFMEASDACDGLLPVPLNYCGASTTGRWSGWAYNCMTAGHELLTPSGWVDIKNWEAGTPVMQWSPLGKLSWCLSPKKVQYEHDGPVVLLNGPFTRGVFTPDHRVPFFRGRHFGERTAGWISDHSGLDGVPVAGIYRGPESGGYTCTQVRFLVALAADGCVTKSGEIRFGFRRQRKIDRLLGILEDLGITAETRVYDYREKPDNHWVAVIPKSSVAPWMNKGFGPWVLALSRAALDTLIAELPHWDGMPHSKTGNTCFFTSDYEQAGWVSTALHLSGRGARVGERSHGRFDVYARSTATTSATGEVDHFKGTVYCPQVDTGFVLVRYDGAIHVTGNCQNLPRINPKTPKNSDALRKCMRAPAGHKVVVADLSGIELRVNHYLWKVPSSMQLYASDAEADLYREFAAARYNIRPEEVSKDQRQLAKVAQLGLGFGAGWRTFKKVAKLMGGLDLSDEDAEAVTVAWRTQYAEIANGWRTCHARIQSIYDGAEVEVDPWGLVTTCKEGFRLPSGRLIRYPDLRMEQGEDGKEEWWYGQGRHKARIYAGKADENLVQALARDIIADNAVDFFRSSGMRPALMVHDELVYIVPDADAQGALDELQKIMRTPPKWWPQIVTWSEGDIANTYGDAK